MVQGGACRAHSPVLHREDELDAEHSNSPIGSSEVISESTARVDRREKLSAYQTLPSLKDYMLIEQDLRAVEIHRRAQGWAMERIIEGSVRLDCLEVEVLLDILHEDVPMAFSGSPT